MDQFVNFLEKNKLFLMIFVALVIVALAFLAIRFEVKQKRNEKKLEKLVTLSIFSAISIILYFLYIPINWILPFIPGFLEIHFSAVPIYLGGYLFGPISGVVIAFLRFFLKVVIGTKTMGVGELSDLIIAVVTVLIASLFYQKYRTKKGAVIATFTIPFFWTVIALLANFLFVLPFYIALFKFDTVFGMLGVIPGITETNYMGYYLLFAALPFNLILSTLVSVVTFFTYKRISRFYQKSILHLEVKEEEEEEFLTNEEDNFIKKA
ncbi:MAG: ECF transporter S component [Acholeplasmataceae bacterium]|nr:ECF transporter S component [Acholeplasmataceae bacterium]